MKTVNMPVPDPAKAVANGSERFAPADREGTVPHHLAVPAGRFNVDPIGAALVVSGADDDLVAARLAAALPAEADLVTVVCASPVTGSSELFDLLPDLLGRWLGGSSAGVRLLLLGAAAPVTTETTQRLADDIGQVVVAPLGPVGAEARTAAREGWVRCAQGGRPVRNPRGIRRRPGPRLSRRVRHGAGGSASTPSKRYRRDSGSGPPEPSTRRAERRTRSSSTPTGSGS